MTQFRKILIALLVLASPNVIRAEDVDETPKKTIEFPSPDGRFAFRYSGSKSEDEIQTYLLIEKASGKVLKTVAKSDPDLGASARFAMEAVLWRPDSKGFALTAFLWRRGTSLFVFMRDGSTFREIKLPDLSIEIPEKAKKGKNFPHVAGLDSTTAKSWQKDGSLLVEIETVVDGEGATLTATRTVILGFNHFAKAEIIKSTVNFAIEDQ
ncbi:MAG TPA: hypothetical protein VLH83_02815 [Chthoniobacterales bacterium]|nr:hypothetical protein [Chthoniobacterales bacterium]